MEQKEAKQILEHLWDFATAETEKCGELLGKAVEVAINAINTIESIEDIIREEERYPVSTNHPNQEDYDKVAAGKFQLIWEEVSKAKTLESLSQAERSIVNRFTKKQLLEEAELVEECGEYLYPSLIGYSPDELRRLAEVSKQISHSSLSKAEISEEDCPL